LESIRPIARFGFFIATIGIFGSCAETGPVEVPDSSFVLDKLPMNEVPLKDLSQFRAAAGNWQTVGKVISDFQVPLSFDAKEGSGAHCRE